MKPIKQELEERGLLFQNSSPDIFEKLDKAGVSFYCGFDPTADSLHLGNFIGFMVAIHLMRRGNKYTALTGGATGMIGDPGGKDSERNFLSMDDLENNQKAISNQISGILEQLKNNLGQDFKYDFVNNKDFYENMGYLDFLREVGKFITVNNMIAKDTVKKRIEDPSKSISYTEFSYMLLQGYDFSYLFKNNNTILQIGGQDQWGNLVTGVEIIRKKYDGEAYAITWPLITDSSGKKFGKSEGNAIWLDKNKTSPYEIYQYFMNTADSDVERYLKMLTLIEVEDIDEMVSKHMKKPEERQGQKILAYEVVKIIHGKKGADLAVKISEFMFGVSPHPNPICSSSSPHPTLSRKGEGNVRIDVLMALSSSELETFKNAMGGFEYSGENLFETIVKSGLEKSNSGARNSIKSGAIFINEKKVEDFNLDVAREFLENRSLLLRKGKKNFRIITKK